MKILVAKDAGYCFGVRDVVNIAKKSGGEYDSVYMLGDIVHNERVVSDLEKSGSVVVNNLDEIPEDKPVLFRAHGTDPKVWKEAQKKKLNIVWDAGNGSAGEVMKKISEKIQGKSILLFDEIDGNFPNHHPDPSEPNNLQSCIKTLKKNKYDLGIAFDGDGDRIGIIDDKGRILSGDKILLIFAYDLLEKQKASVIGDVKCSQVLFDEIKRMGGNPIMSKTGHSHIKVNMKKYSAKLAGEMSGHIFFADKYYGFDDALYAAIRIIDILCNKDNSLSQIVDKIPEVFAWSLIKR